jgi:O-antigen ligase
MISLAYAALWMFVFSLPWEGVVRIGGVAVVSRVTGMLALAIALLAIVISARIRRWHTFHIAALLFVIWAGCVLLVSHMPEWPNKFWTFVQLFLVLFMVWELAASWRRVLGLLMAYVFGAYVAAFQTILVYRTTAGALRRFAAGEVDPNDLAMNLVLALPIAWYLGMTYRQPLLRWACRAYLPVGLVAIGLTGSRGGMVATIVALLIVPLTMTKLTPARLAAAIVILGVSGALAVAYVPEKLVQRFATTGTEVQEGSLHGRVDIWKAGIKAFAQRPLMGYGTANFKAAVRPWGEGQVAHNSYLSVLVEEGLVGFLLYATMFIAVFMARRNLPLLDRRFMLVMLATLGTAMLPLTWEDRKPVWFILAALLGLSQALAAGVGEAVQPTSPRRTAPIARPPKQARPVGPLTAARRNAPHEPTA